MGTFGAPWATMGWPHWRSVRLSASVTLLETLATRVEPLDQRASRRRVAGGDFGVSSDQIDTVPEDSRARVVPRARHRFRRVPPVAARIHYQDVTEHRVFCLRLP